MKVIYGLSTKSIEDFSQCVLVDAPDGMEADELAEYLDEVTDKEPTPNAVQEVVGVTDALESMVMAMRAEEVDETTIRRVYATVFDAIGRNAVRLRPRGGIRMTRHELTYVMTGCTVKSPALITEEGDIEPAHDERTVTEIEDSWLYCETCKCRVFAGDEEHGLSDDWQEV